MTSSPNAAGLRAAKRLIALHGISSFCYGMVFPYTSVFLSARPGVGTSGVAVYFAASGVAGLAVSAILGLGWLRPRRVALGLAGNALSCLGFLLVPMVASVRAAGVSGSLVGAGQACFLAAVIPIVSSLVDPARARKVFAVRYQVLNAALALGSLAAAVLARIFSRDVIHYLFLVNAGGYLATAAGLLLARKAAATGQAAAAESGRARDEGTGMTAGPLVKALLGVLLFELVIAVFAYSQFETTGPLVAYRLMGTGLDWIPVMIAVNVAVVVVAQLPVTSVLARRSDVFGLRVAVATWVLGYLLAAGSAALPPGGRLVGLIGYAAIFGMAECAYSCSFYPWMISRVPDRELTRATALTNGMMGAGTLAGPVVGVTLIATGSATIVWLSLAGLCSGAALMTVGHQRARRRPQRRRSSSKPQAARTAGMTSSASR